MLPGNCENHEQGGLLCKKRATKVAHGLDLCKVHAKERESIFGPEEGCTFCRTYNEGK